DIDIENCPESIPTEYYNCAENIYLYRDISDSADCVDGKIKPYTTLFEFLKKQDTDDRCFDSDYTQIDRFTDGSKNYDVDGSILISSPFHYLYRETTPAFIIQNDGSICNPFNGEAKEMVFPDGFCDQGKEEMKDTSGKTSDYGYCIGPSKDIEAKAYSCKKTHPENRNIVIELVLLEPYSKEDNRYQPWFCSDKTVDNIQILNRLRDKTIVDFYEDFPENCREYGIDYWFSTSGYFADGMNIVNEMICDPFTGELKTPKDFFDIRQPIFVNSVDNCIGDFFDIPVTTSDAYFTIPESKKKFVTRIYLPFPEYMRYDFTEQCDGQYEPVMKSDYELYSRYCSSNYYDYEYEDEDSFKVFSDNGYMCCPDDGAYELIEECSDLQFDLKAYQYECEDNNLIFRYTDTISLKMQDSENFVFDLYKRLYPETTYKECDVSLDQSLDKKLSDIAYDHCSDYTYVPYADITDEAFGEYAVEDIMLIEDLNGNICNPYTGQPMPAVQYNDQDPPPSENYFCMYNNIGMGVYKCHNDREMLQYKCDFNIYVDDSWRYDHIMNNVQVLKELSEQEASFNCVDTEGNGKYDLVGEELVEIYTESTCIQGTDYILCDPDNLHMCNEQGILVIINEYPEYKGICNPFEYGKAYPYGGPCINTEELGIMCYYDQPFQKLECEPPGSLPVTPGVLYPTNVDYQPLMYGYKPITDGSWWCVPDSEGNYHPTNDGTMG
ncbi:MAG: hypothetical protein KKF44_03285, partial [Nanoarchaeota archaeon]|nr:hypothetical protein [Nanoarchaeota archaeon]